MTWRLLNIYARRFDVRLLAFREETEPLADLSPLREICRDGVVTIPMKMLASRHPAHHLALAARSLTRPRVPFRMLKFASRSMVRQVADSLSEFAPDLIHCDDVMMVQYGANARQPVISLRHNVDWEIYARRAEQTRNPLLRLFLKLEVARLRHIDRHVTAEHAVTFTLSERDRKALERAAPDGRFEVFRLPVPLGDAVHAPPRTQNVLSFGTLSWPGVEDGLLWFHQHVWPRVREMAPSAQWQIAGANAGPRIRRLDGQPGISVLGFVPDLDDLFRQARVAIVPLHVAGGIRIKLLDLFASGLPSVATSIGAEGLEVQSGRELIVADDAESFARGVADLLSDDARWEQIRDAGRDYVRRYHEPEFVQQEVERWLDDVLAHVKT